MKFLELVSLPPVSKVTVLQLGPSHPAGRPANLAWDPWEDMDKDDKQQRLPIQPLKKWVQQQCSAFTEGLQIAKLNVLSLVPKRFPGE